MNHTEHLLTILSEECIEVAKEISKANRFGLHESSVEDIDGPTNCERIVSELNDLIAVIKMAVYEDILPIDWEDINAQDKKIGRVKKFMSYAEKCGTIKNQDY